MIRTSIAHALLGQDALDGLGEVDAAVLDRQRDAHLGRLMPPGAGPRRGQRAPNALADAGHLVAPEPHAARQVDPLVRSPSPPAAGLPARPQRVLADRREHRSRVDPASRRCAVSASRSSPDSAPTRMLVIQ